MIGPVWEHEQYVEPERQSLILESEERKREETEWRQWVPPPEPYKPRIPYRKGTKLQIYRHDPPEPFGYPYDPREKTKEARTELEWKAIRGRTLVDLCLAHPPIGGVTYPDESHEVEITGQLAIKDCHDAQVFLCQLDGSPQVYVGKAYDPLYYGFAGEMGIVDVTYEADGNYSREAAAYKHLEGQQVFGNGEIPKFHGSWTFELPISLPKGTQTRSVRMILLEHVDGETMVEMEQQAAVHTMSDWKRLDVMSRVMELGARLFHANINYRYLFGSKIIVCDDDQGDNVRRVCLIDFTKSEVIKPYQLRYDLDPLEARPASPDSEKAPLPQNPIDSEWWTCGIQRLNLWVPREWFTYEGPIHYTNQLGEEQWKRWLLERYSDPDEFEQPTYEKQQWDAEVYRDYLARCNEGTPECPNLGSRSGSLPPRLSPEPPPCHSQPLGCITLDVRDYDAAKEFYTTVLRSLGLTMIDDSADQSAQLAGTRKLCYGEWRPSFSTVLLVLQKRGEETEPLGNGSTIHLNAPNQQAVDEFRETAITLGGRCEREPRQTLNGDNGSASYSTLIVCPNGWRFEVVYFSFFDIPLTVPERPLSPPSSIDSFGDP